MSIAGYTPKREAVTLPGAVVVEVRALSLADLTTLFRRHTGAFTGLFEKYVAQASKADPTATMQQAFQSWQVMGGASILGGVLDSFPDLVADAIAHGADEPQHANLVRMFPAGAQLELALHVVNLTVEAEGGVKKFMGTVGTLLRTAAPKTD